MAPPPQTAHVEVKTARRCGPHGHHVVEEAAIQPYPHLYLYLACIYPIFLSIHVHSNLESPRAAQEPRCATYVAGPFHERKFATGACWRIATALRSVRREWHRPSPFSKLQLPSRPESPSVRTVTGWSCNTRKPTLLLTVTIKGSLVWRLARKVPGLRPPDSMEGSLSGMQSLAR